MVREWSEFGSEFRSKLELELEGGPRVANLADFIHEKWKSGEMGRGCGNVENLVKFY